ncbi:uncharacterized protein LOC127750752 [Frankliniella occidentalis]|uniref:Uncharacterized protein LOC127750752 n=1 Tax=Frankliniella occidentalis TaxID=133901 RepID=A0A9C6X4Q9_FRAOC|nr:uncharacterized protein LOC127750752 [Frankliniella occidentalis]
MEVELSARAPSQAKFSALPQSESPGDRHDGDTDTETMGLGVQLGGGRGGGSGRRETRAARAAGVAAGAGILVLLLLIVLLWTGVGTGVFRHAPHTASARRRTPNDPPPSAHAAAAAPSARAASASGPAATLGPGDGGGGGVDDAIDLLGHSGENDSEVVMIGEVLEEDKVPMSLAEVVLRPDEGVPDDTPLADSVQETVQSETQSGTSPWTQPWTPTQPPGQPLSQYVKPVKVAPPPLAERDLRSGAAPTTGSPPLRPSGHFRHMQADLWDPHPQYRFTAFGISFWLQLAHDAGFVDPNILVTHMTHNTTVRSPARQHAQCFYTGRVRDDQKSSVAVNLCHGMRGTIRTSQGSFFIEPVEEERPVDEDDNDAGEEDAGTGAAAASAGQASPRPSPLHVIYRVPKPPHENLAEEPTHHCGMVDGESTFSPVGET